MIITRTLKSVRIVLRKVWPIGSKRDIHLILPRVKTWVLLYLKTEIMHKYEFYYFTTASFKANHKLVDIFFADDDNQAKQLFFDFCKQWNMRLFQFKFIKSNELLVDRFDRFVLTVLQSSDSFDNDTTQWFLYDNAVCVGRWDASNNGEQNAKISFESKKANAIAHLIAWEKSRGHGIECHCLHCSI